MPKKKQSMSAKIRALLDQGMEPKAIAKKLGIAPAYVHTIKWSWSKKAAANGNGEKTTFTIAEKDNGTQVVYDHTTPGAPFNNNLEQYVRDQVTAQVAARVQAVFEGIR